jgi:ectoine hydroxylase-related dioxygenase (phytanoyl-CoA dioxygenase family)
VWGRRFVPRKFVDQNPYVDEVSDFELVPDIEAVRDQHEIVSFDMQPGDVIAFHYRTLHSAPGTAGRTAHRRRAVSFRYLGADARFATRPWLHSPPYEPIAPGQPLDDERFPLVSV